MGVELSATENTVVMVCRWKNGVRSQLDTSKKWNWPLGVDLESNRIHPKPDTMK